MNIVVQKFGGTSVRDLQCQKQVLTKVKRALAQRKKVVVVLSAMAGETNRLISLAQEWDETPDPAEMDSLVSTGEQVSTALFAMLCKKNGIACRSVLGFQANILTDQAYTRARILDIDTQKLKTLLTQYDVLAVAGSKAATIHSALQPLGEAVQILLPWLLQLRSMQMYVKYIPMFPEFSLQTLMYALKLVNWIPLPMMKCLKCLFAKVLQMNLQKNSM